MAADRDNSSDSGPAGSQQQLDLPFATPAEHAKFFDIIRQLEAGTLSDEKARERVLQLYDTSLGAWVRALGRSHPQVATRVAQGLLRDLEQVAENLRADGSASSPSKVHDKQSRPRGPRLTSKLVDVLERERLLLETLLRYNEAQTLADLRKIAAKAEPDIEAAALTANLDRLKNDGVIDRPRKGYYLRNDDSQKYLDALRAEIEARGSKKR